MNDQTPVPSLTWNEWVDGPRVPIDGDRLGQDTAPEPLRERVRVGIDADEYVAVDATVGALQNDLTMFQRSGALVRVVQHNEGVPIIEAVPTPTLRELLTRICWFFKRTDDGDRQVHPPAWLFNAVGDRGQWPGVRSLATVITCPTFSKDGTLIVTPGYHEAGGGLWHHATLTEIPTIPENPTPDEIAMARDVLLDIIYDFPFVDDASRANALALMLLPFVRLMIDGPTPLHLIDAPTPGTGKTLLALILMFPFLGHLLHIASAPGETEEWRKRILSVLMEARQVIIFDNAKHRLDSEHLASVLTTTMWTDRVLGVSRTTTVSNRAVWIATGNNTALGKDVTRRTIWIRLDPKMESPETRMGFRHADLIGFVRTSRPQLVAAALTLIRAWVVAGQPTGNAVMGQFESYASAMSGILNVSGIGGFMSNATSLREQVDGESLEWRGFVQAWFDVFGIRTVGVAQLATLLWDAKGNRTDIMAETVNTPTERGTVTKLGRLLSKRRDCVVGKFTIRVGDGQNGRLAYRLDIAPESTPRLSNPQVSEKVSEHNSLDGNGLQPNVDFGDFITRSANSNPTTEIDVETSHREPDLILEEGDLVSKVSNLSQVSVNKQVTDVDFRRDFPETSPCSHSPTRLTPFDENFVGFADSSDREITEL